MNTKSLFLFFLLIPTFLFFIPSSIYAAPPGNASDWEMTFNDEFNGTTLDRTKWNTRYQFGETIINNELQAYVSDAFVFDDVQGIFRIKGEKRQALYNDDSQLMNYTSGVITTNGKFSQKYGYFEIRCKMPKGQGLWSAFWMRVEDSVLDRYEIDIHEFLGHQPKSFYFTNHDEINNYHSQNMYTTSLPLDLTQDYYTIGAEWTSSAIRLYVNNTLQFTHTQGVPQEPMYILTNLAIGGGWPGSPNTNTVFPAYYDIDYIRAYRKKDTTVSAPSILPQTRTFTAPIQVSLITSSSGAEIRYTTNGTDPTASSSLYTGPFSLSTSATVKSRAFMTGMTASSVTTSSFTIVSNATAISAPWQKTDVGTVEAPGNSLTDGTTYVISGAGSAAIDWGKPNDAFHMMYVPLNGNGEITARIVTIDPINPWAVAGLTMRSSLSKNASHATIEMMPTGLRWIYRVESGNPSDPPIENSAITIPVLLKLNRVGNTFTASRFSTIENRWIVVGSASTNMPQTVYIGLVSSSHYPDSLNTSQFDTLGISGAIPTVSPSATLTPSCKVGDVNCNGSINASDLLQVLGKYGISGGSGNEDQNGDGKVNMIDASLIVKNWGL